MRAQAYSNVGLVSVTVVSTINATVSIPYFHAGASYVDATATKINQSKSSQVVLRACSTCGTDVCCEDGDPVLLTLPREEHWMAMKVVAAVPEAESKIAVTNGTPGLDALSVVVNGRRFRVSGLRDGEEMTVDVASAMRPGNTNEFVLRASGKRGSSAGILIWDGVGDAFVTAASSARAGQLAVSR